MGFFDELSKKATQTYKNTAEKTNKLTREMKLKSLINDDKDNIEKIYAEIGKKVYEKHIREENIDIKSELIEECSKIDAYAKEIEDMRVELLALKGFRICKQCAAEIPVNAKFCPKCGSMQEDVENNSASENQNVEENNNKVEEVVSEEPTNTENYQAIETPEATKPTVAEVQFTPMNNENGDNGNN